MAADREEAPAVGLMAGMFAVDMERVLGCGSG